MVGSSITQDSTLTNLLKDKLNGEVYNIAPAGFEDFIALLNSGVMNKPNTVILSFVENSIPSPLKLSSKIETPQDVSSFLVSIDKIKRLYSLKYFNVRIRGKHGKGIPGENDSIMFFHFGNKQPYHYDKLTSVAETLQSYKEYCDSIGVNFLFLPVPNKDVGFPSLELFVNPNI